tara:strand:- start:44 stop:790 length:747 start_codon:yes stop_codon:yes gene_type:complete
MKENMMKEDMMSSDVQIDEIGDTKMGEAKGVMNFPKERARVAQKIMSQQKFKGLPKRWKGRGDYFFETQDDGTIKVTGGDKASSLTGGKSTIVRDKERIQKIIEAARDGDVIEENVTYKSSDMSKEEMDTIPQRTMFESSDYQAGGGIKSFGESDAEAGMEERLQESGPDVRKADMARGVDLSSERESEVVEDDPVLKKFKETMGALRNMIEKEKEGPTRDAYSDALSQLEGRFLQSLQQRGIALNKK